MSFSPGVQDFHLDMFSYSLHFLPLSPTKLKINLDTLFINNELNMNDMGGMSQAELEDPLMN